ncbi:MAG: 50S ribosomal protein L11 methyltransferase [Candidatus Alectryocaccobium sp.]|jgi:ribosomal protein L11 methyltransferase
MKWNKYTLKINADAEDIVSATLAEVGVQGVEIEDKKPLTGEELKGMFVDIAPSFPVDDNIAYMHFYMDPDEDNEEILEAARRELDSLREFTDIGEAVITRSETEDKDWINNWKEYFHHFYVDDILIVPSWEEIPKGDEDKMILHIDPGTAFGTGMHETTQLCIRQLKKYVKPGDKILDVGTGSGILGIVALKLGAGSAVGTDLDPCTVNAVKENKETNDIKDESFSLILGNIIDDKEVQDSTGYDKYDIVTANILADVLVPLAPQIIKHIKKGGILITSGILDVKEKEVADALVKAGFTIEEVTAQGEWVSITARR